MCGSPLFADGVTNCNCWWWRLKVVAIMIKQIAFTTMVQSTMKESLWYTQNHALKLILIWKYECRLEHGL